MGVSRKPGRPGCFHVRRPDERPEYQLSAHRLVVVTTGDTKPTAATRGTAEQREPKRGGTDSRESERPDSTVDGGEIAAQRGPGGGKRGVTSHNRCWVLFYRVLGRRVLRNLNSVSPKQHRIAELAKRSPELVFTSLAHLIDLEWLLEAYRRTRKDGAAGVDGQTAADYEANLSANLQSLLERARIVPASTTARGAFSRPASRGKRLM